MSSKSVSTVGENHMYTEAWNGSDVILIVEEEKIHVHSAILALASPVFKTMFESEFKESMEKTVDLPGKEKSVFKDMLNLIYPVHFNIKDYPSCRGLLELAREYDIQKVREDVDEFLSEKVSSSFSLVQLTEEFHLPRTHTKVVDHYVDVWNERQLKVFTDDWSSISEKTKTKIMRRKISALSPNCANGYCKASDHCTHDLTLPRSKIQTLQNMMDVMVPDKE